MKRTFMILVALLVALVAATVSSAADVVFHNANQFTLGWDLVTVDTDGDPISGVSYEVVMANALTDPTKANPAIVARPAAGIATATVTIGVKGRYFVGVRSVWDGLKSGINWGDLPDGQTVPEFGVRFAAPPKTPDGLKKN
jgi:hypothetical protein